MEKQEGGLVRKNTEYDEYVDVQAPAPELAPLTASETPDEEEQAHYDTMYADFIDLLYEDSVKQVTEMLSTGGDMYDRASQAAFMLLNKVYREHDMRDGPTPQAALFGEGGMIHTAVDEIFQFAQARHIPGADEQDQYTAAQINMMRLVGEELEKEQDDDAVEEAQSLMVDVEMQDPNYALDPQPLGAEDKMALEDIEAQGAAAQAPPVPQEQGAAPAPQPQAPTGGLI
jgi:hypothetical protein